jgi:putative ABC transport system substrate-binding protein
MKRRAFITLLGGAAAWPLAARAQQRKPMRRVGALMPWTASDPQVQARYAAFLQGLQQVGWTVGNNVQIDSRWTAGNEDETRKHASELVALAPEVIFASGSATVGPLLRATRTVPIVFANVPDPSAPDMSKAWRDRVATVPVLPPLSMGLVQNGWSCSSRLRQA